MDLSRNRTFTRVRKGRGPDYKQGVTRTTVPAALDDLRARLDHDPPKPAHTPRPALSPVRRGLIGGRFAIYSGVAGFRRVMRPA